MQTKGASAPVLMFPRGARPAMASLRTAPQNALLCGVGKTQCAEQKLHNSSGDHSDFRNSVENVVTRNYPPGRWLRGESMTPSLTSVPSTPKVFNECLQLGEGATGLLCKADGFREWRHRTPSVSHPNTNSPLDKVPGKR